jgi:hypothetical protein
MKWAVWLLAAGALWAGDDPRLTYSKSFPGSVPPFMMVTLEKNGDAEYKEALDDDQPLKFKLTEADTQAMFGLAEKLEWFKRPLESPLKVAFMGTKIFHYESGATSNEVKFNYSEDPSAQALHDWFERLCESAQYRIELERTAKYDKLGVVHALSLLEAALDRKRLVALEQYLPMLDRIGNNESYMHTARAQAAAIAEAIRAAKPAANDPPAAKPPGNL